MVCVGTQCVPSVAARVVAKIYRPFFFYIFGLVFLEKLEHACTRTTYHQPMKLGGEGTQHLLAECVCAAPSPHCHPVPAEEDVSSVLAIDPPAASAVRPVRRARAQARARVCMTAAGCMAARGARRVGAPAAALAAAWAAAAALGALDLGLDLALDLGLEIGELGLLVEVVPIVEHVEDVIEPDDVLGADERRGAGARARPG